MTLEEVHMSYLPLIYTLTLQFQRGQLYAVAEASKEATTGQTAIEILKNEPFDDPVMGRGQFTHKIYHIAGYGDFDLLPLLNISCLLLADARDLFRLLLQLVL